MIGVGHDSRARSSVVIVEAKMVEECRHSTLALNLCGRGVVGSVPLPDRSGRAAKAGIELLPLAWPVVVGFLRVGVADGVEGAC